MILIINKSLDAHQIHA